MTFCLLGSNKKKKNCVYELLASFSVYYSCLQENKQVKDVCCCITHQIYCRPDSDLMFYCLHVLLSAGFFLRCFSSSFLLSFTFPLFVFGFYRFTFTISLNHNPIFFCFSPLFLLFVLFVCFAFFFNFV